MTTKNGKLHKTLPQGTLSASEALSWGMFGDRGLLNPVSITRGEKFPPPTRSYAEARRELRDALARGDVKARGFKADRNRPPIGREALDPGRFEGNPNVAVDAFGEATYMHPASPQNIPKWNRIVFEEAEVHALWPKPTPDLNQWMLKDALKAGLMKKR